MMSEKVQFDDVSPPRRWWHTALLWLTFAGAVSVVGFFAGLAAMYIAFSHGLPTFDRVEDYRPKLVTRVYAIDHQLIGEFSVERRILLPFEQIPKTMVQAFIASEDSGFFDHQGIDYVGLVRSVIKTATSKGQQGGSTISMQVAKSFLDGEIRKGAKSKSLIAKLRYKGSQILLARRFEASLTKDEILYLYLNQIYLGHGAYGVQAAAENYFRKNVGDLTLSEQALIAGLPQAPSRFSPFTHPDRARERQRYVLRRMLEEKFVSQAELDRALAEPLVVHPLEDVFRDTAPHFVESVRRQLADKYGDKALYEEGLSVYTTIDLDRQRAAERAVADGLHELDKRQGFRGPLANLADPDIARFVAAYDLQLEPELSSDKAYLALVIDVSAERALIQIGSKHKGQIPIAAMRWARKPNPLVYFEYQLQDNATKILRPGDVVWARSTSKTELMKDKASAALIGRIGGNEPLYGLEQEPIAESALLSANPHSGYVHAMVGGYNFDASELNRTTQACRQPGSSFKPLIYAAAFDAAGFTPATILQDSPVVFDDPDNQVRWKPENSQSEFKGDVTVRTAFQMSMNIPAVKTLEKVKMDTAIAYARRLGISSKINRDFSMALGASCVSMWELSGVYGVFASLGYKPRYQVIRRVVDRDGRLLEDHSHPGDPTVPVSSKLRAIREAIYRPRELVLDPVSAFIVNRMLTNVVNGGTGSYASRVGKNVAGKTGTTNDQFDAWFMGFSRDMVTGVWVGHDKNERPLGALEYGGRAALPIWTDYMIAALRGVDQPAAEPPAGVVQVRMDPETGLLAGEGGRSVQEYFRKGTEPKDAATPEKNSGDDFYKADSKF